jgi:hypothetical protein
VVYLYGTKTGQEPKLVATFDSEQQLLAYVRWATLQEGSKGIFKFEQGSVLVGFTGYRYQGSSVSDTVADDDETPHNPSPSML